MTRGIVLGLAAVFALAGAAWAGDYHDGGTLICSDCHVMHASQSHGYNADGSGIYSPIGGSAPYEYLLRDEVNTLCLSCHDNQAFAPDVFEANGGAAATRIAGALNNTQSSGTYNPADGHTLYSTDVAPGGTFTNADGLNCVDCHQQHGYQHSYRNLIDYEWDHGNNQPGATFVSYAIGTNDLTKDVFERSTTSDHYDIANVDYNEPDATASKIGRWCQNCHTDFHGSSSDANMRDQSGDPGEEWYRHPTADANIGSIGGGHSNLDVFKTALYRPKVMSPTGEWGTQGQAWDTAPSDLTPSCFSCHKSHGNQNAFGLIFMTGAADPGEEGDGTQVKDICQRCHVQG